MNYQHAFHAGNFADVHKHVVLTRILAYLRGKPAGFRVIDSHAGAGCYDLTGAQATRSGEWRDGIARVFAGADDAGKMNAAARALLAPYLDTVAALNRGSGLRGSGLRFYPGSPLIAKALLRRQDRLIACELEPAAAASLKLALRGEPRAKVLPIDGWMALKANIPPKERRGLVLVDPAYEDNADFLRLDEALAQAHRKWPGGLYLLWYPIKSVENTVFSAGVSAIPPASYRTRQQNRRQGADALAWRLGRSGIPKLLRCELSIDPAHAQGGLTGSGLIIVNPPYPLERELQMILPALVRWLAPTSGSYRLDWLSGE